MKTFKITSLILGLVVAATIGANAQDLSSDIRSTSADATTSGEELYESATPNLTHTLSGKLPGLFVIKGDGTPGYGTSKMYIRGIGSYAQSTDQNTLKFYVDGFEVRPEYIEYLTPDEISSISVLKDAAALSTFGMNGANGILWI
jgi:TonB-dependent SusC/RagA subfamily outer membrane receptor